ncbi:MAG: SIMPL domain-containing protein [Candidatus Acidiferrales bacterium]
METRRFAIAALLVMFGISAANAQQIQVNRENRTIAVSATDSVEVDAEVAIIQLGYHNYGRTHEATYNENISAADKIVDALVAAGVPKVAVQTQALTLATVDPEKEWTPAQKEERQFEATQSWRIRLAASNAQTVVDIAVRAGANSIESIDWQVSDPKALEAKADASALAKARTLAENMATRLGAKIGELVYASNQTPADRFITVNSESASLARPAPPPPPPNLKLFPQKVSQQATVYAVFALQ